MIAEELQNDLESLDLVKNNFPTTRSMDNKDEKKEMIFPIEQRYMYRYNKITVRGEEVLVPKSCRSCHGTGKIGQVIDQQTKSKYTAYCTCLVRKEEKHAT